MSGGITAVTGASGYVGSIVAAELRRHMPVVAMVRNPRSDGEIAWSLESEQDIVQELRNRGVRNLVHAAWDMRTSNRREMERICVAGSARLFSAAVQAGVERIVFISTISAFENCRSAYGQTKLAVEKLLPRETARVAFRCGLVFGCTPGGVFGSIRRQARTSRILPLIGDGLAPQYLLHENTLAQALRRAVCGDFDGTDGAPITLAHPKPWPLRELVRSIAASEGRNPVLLPIPWQALYAAARTAEALRLPCPFRSDSIVSLVHHDRKPDFTALPRLRIEPLPYNPEAVEGSRQCST